MMWRSHCRRLGTSDARLRECQSSAPSVALMRWSRSHMSLALGNYSASKQSSLGIACLGHVRGSLAERTKMNL